VCNASVKAGRALGRSPVTNGLTFAGSPDGIGQMFAERFGNLDMPISTFVNGPAAHVAIIDLEARSPSCLPSSHSHKQAR
jgi:hypothetical protein